MRGALTSGAFLVILLSGCSLLLKTAAPQQCSTASDCARGGSGQVCNQGFCVASEVALDASSDAPENADDATVDALSDAEPPCDPAKPFAAPVLLPGFVAQSGKPIASARISPAGNELLLSRLDQPLPKKQQIWRLTLGADNLTWGGEQLLMPFNTPLNNPNTEIIVSSVSFHSGTRAYYSAQMAADNYYALMKIERTNIGSPWVTPTQVTFQGKPATYTVEFPFYHPGTATLYYMSAGAGGRYTLHSASAISSQMSGITAINFGNVGNGEYAPVVTDDGLTMYFATTTAQNRRIYRSVRATTAATWNNIVAAEVPELGLLGTINHPSWVSKDNCEIIITRDNQIMKARKPR